VSVEGAHGSCLGEAGDEGSGTHLGSTTSGGEDGADTNVVDKGGVDLGTLDDGVEDAG
jgi:hypothetical protein